MSTRTRCVLGFFVTKIFHPNVSKQGEVCVSTLKKDWKKTLGIKHILLVIIHHLTPFYFAINLVRSSFTMKQQKDAFFNLSNYSCLLFATVGGEVLADLSEPRIGIERGGRTVALGAVRRLRKTCRVDDRNPCSVGWQGCVSTTQTNRSGRVGGFKRQ